MNRLRFVVEHGDDYVENKEEDQEDDADHEIEDVEALETLEGSVQVMVAAHTVEDRDETLEERHVEDPI